MKSTFATLDGMRGIAAIFVLIIHTGSYWGNLNFHHSYLAVDLFFLLSGFVIAHAYEKKLESKKITPNQFIIIRLIRLYPMYFISAFITSILFIGKYLSGQNESDSYLSHLILSILLTFSFLPSSMPGSILLFPLNTPYWSVFYELIINTFYAFLRSKLSNGVLYKVIVALGLLMGLIAIFHGSLDAGLTWRPTSIAAGLTRSGFGIFLGICLYRVGRGCLVNFIVSEWVLLGFISLVFMVPDLGFWNGPFDLLAIIILFPISVVLGVRCKCSPLAEYVFSVLGRSSYPVYLIHVPLASIVYFFIGDLVETYAPISGALFVIILIIFSIQIERIYDIPVRQYLTRRYVK